MSTHRRINVAKIGDVTVVKFLDKKILDEANIQELGLELFSLIEHDNRKSILLNFSDVEFLSSCLLYTSPSPRDRQKSRMPSSA